MKKSIILLVSCLITTLLTANTYIDTSEDNWTYGTMHQWQAHIAYSVIDEIAMVGDVVYALSSHSLFSIDKITEEISYHNQLTGLNSSVIHHISHNESLNELMICYQNGQIDIVDETQEIVNISDLYHKQASISKQINDICMYQNKAFLAMDFGVICLDMKRKEIEDTYYIGTNSTEVSVQFITILDDTIYALSNQTLYTAAIDDNLMDYSYWHASPLPVGKEIQGVEAFAERVCIVRDSCLWSYHNQKWTKHPSEFSLRGLRKTKEQLFVLVANQYGAFEVMPDLSLQLTVPYGYVHDIQKDGNSYWLATENNGVVRTENNNYQEFHPDGPINNVAYRMRFFEDRLYVLPGGRWATENKTFGEIMYYENGIWTNITNGQLTDACEHPLYDFMNVAQDPNDKNHYFITSYGTGLLELYDTTVVQLYLPNNSNLQSAAPNDPDNYTRTDAAMYDEQGNLWILNAGGDINNVHVVSAQGEWHSFNLQQHDTKDVIRIETPGEILVDKRNPQWKWIPLCRYNTGLVLLQDNGSPTDPRDDKAVYRQQWVDQYNNLIIPEYIYTIAQDHNNTIWVGTSRGLFTIPAHIDFTRSNQCEKIYVRRNDGTNLVDYLLENEQINCIVVDGANRKWIGTAASGAYLIEIGKDDNGNTDVHTIAHFTTDNSPLLSNNVLSIAIQESTGEVFFGTSNGLISYVSDASEPEKDFSNIYAYPNPVYPTYKGFIIFKGLMADTQVRVIDSSGNAVTILHSNGGEAIWDGKNSYGERVASGIYTAICNTSDGNAYGVVKVMIMN